MPFGLEEYLELVDTMARALQSRKLKLAASAEAGRTQALRLCRHYSAKRWHQSQEQTAKIIQAVQQANRRLAQWHSSASGASLPQPHTTTLPEAPPMAAPEKNKKDTHVNKIHVDKHSYDLDTLSDEAKAQLQSLHSSMPS